MPLAYMAKYVAWHPSRPQSRSPDGSLITFVGTEAEIHREGIDGEGTDREGKHQDQVFVVRIDSAECINTERIKLSQGFEKAFSPVFSPDGSRIAFAGRRRDKSGGIFTARLDGSDIQQLTDGSVGANSLSWAAVCSRAIHEKRQSLI